MTQHIWIPKRVAERAFTNWEPSPSGCRISTYSTASHGYAQIGWQDRAGRMRGTTAHRAAWVHIHGQIPAGLTIDHKPTCDKRCVHTDHLRKLTNFENGRRTHGKDWPLGECANGHSNKHLFRQWVKGENRYRLRCRECLRIYTKTSNDRVQNDPKKSARKRAQQRASQRKLRSNPEYYQRVLADNRARARRKREAQMKTA